MKNNFKKFKNYIVSIYLKNNMRKLFKNIITIYISILRIYFIKNMKKLIFKHIENIPRINLVYLCFHSSVG